MAAGTLRLLHVDDSEDDRFLLARCLRDISRPVDLTAAESGAEALHALSQASALPDVILLDIRMPGMSGLELLQKLKSDARLAAIPVIMLSSSSVRADVTAARRLGAHSYCVKPPSLVAYRDLLSNIHQGWQNSDLPSCWPEAQNLLREADIVGARHFLSLNNDNASLLAILDQVLSQPHTEDRYEINLPEATVEKVATALSHALRAHGDGAVFGSRQLGHIMRAWLNYQDSLNTIES